MSEVVIQGHWVSRGNAITVRKERYLKYANTAEICQVTERLTHSKCEIEQARSFTFSPHLIPETEPKTTLKSSLMIFENVHVKNTLLQFHPELIPNCMILIHLFYLMPSLNWKHN